MVKEIRSCRRQPAGGRPALLAAVAAGTLAQMAWGPIAPADAAIYNWTGTGGSSWATSTSWSPAGGPGVNDTANFTDTGAFTLPGEVTSALNADRTLSGLIFNNTSGKYHTLDLATRTLTVNGSLNFNTDQSGTTTTVVRNGNLTVGGSFSNLNVGRGLSGSGRATADFSGVAALNATVQEVHVGSTAGGSSNGVLALGTTNAIAAQRLYVGVSSGSGSTSGTLHLGQSNTIGASELHIGKDNAVGVVDIRSGGQLTLGSASQRTLLNVAVENIGTNDDYSGRLDLTGGSMTAHLSNLVVAQRENGGFGDAVGTVIGGTGGTINIGAAGNTANFFVGRKVGNAGDSGAAGIVDFGGSASLVANLDTLSVGTSQVGPSRGTVKLAGGTNNIDALTITVGSGGSQANSLTFGQSNTVLANSMSVGMYTSNGTVTVPAGGTMTLGSESRRTNLSVAVSNVGTNDQYTGTFDATGARLDAFLGDVTVGQKDNGGGGRMIGTLIGGSGGNINVGVGGNASNFHVARKVAGSGDSVVGNVDFVGAASFTANLNTLSVGATLSGTASGTVKLAGGTNNIDALSIVVASGGGGSSSLTFGQSNTVLANELSIGLGSSNGTVTVPAGGTLNLGSAARRTKLAIAVSTNGTNDGYTGKLDLTGATLNAFLGDVTVGQKDNGGFGDSVGTLVGGGGGTINIGGPGNVANVYIGRKVTGTGDDYAAGTVDFGGATSLVANLNTLSLGTANSGSSRGTLALAGTNTIDANRVLIGSGGNSSNSLTLGRTNTILTNQFTIAENAAGGTVTIPVGGSLTLGSAARPASLSIATGSAVDNNLWTGTLDLTGATFVANLDVVTIGQRNGTVSSRSGTLTISDRPDNDVVANTISLATGTGSVTGVLNFGGGRLTAGSITKGVGTASFNWSGGTLGVGTFGTATTPFNLTNNGTGTLSPGTAANPIGTTTVNGNYTQGANATTRIEIAGDSPATGNDLVAVTGTATLAGTLDVSLRDGFVPALGQNFLIGTHGTRTGTYAFVAPPSLPAGVAFQVDYASNANQVMLRTVAPAGQSFTATATPATFGTAGNWTGGVAPGTTSSLTIANATAGQQVITVGASTTVHRIDLAGTAAAPKVLEVPQGIKLGVANELSVGANATLRGGGQVIGNVVVTAGGSLTANSSTGNLAVDGNLVAQAGATLRAGIAGSADALRGRVTVTEAAAVGGELELTRQNGYVATAGDSYLLIAAASRTGTFAKVTGMDAGNDLRFAVTYAADGVRVTAAHPADSNLDSKIDVVDLGTLATYYGTAGGATWSTGDFNGDGTVNVVDLGILSTYYGQNFATPSLSGTGLTFEQALARYDLSTEAIPEPASAGLVAVAGIGLLARRRRR